jgi:hypothetical protein
MERPTGVTVISIFQFIGAAFCILLAVGMLIGGSFVGAIIGTAAGGDRAGATGVGIGMLVGVVGGIAFLIIAALHVLVAWGMWTLKNWARMVTLVLAAIGAVMQVFGVLGSLLHFHIFALIWSMIVLGINALIVWYLLQPQVKAAFEGPSIQTRAAGV